MDSPGRRSGSAMSLRKLGLVVAIFFFMMGTTVVVLYKYLNTKSSGGTEQKPEGAFGIPLRKESSRLRPNGGERMSILSMDAEHVRRLFDVLFEDINNAKEAYEDIMNLLEEYKVKRGISKKTKSFIDMLLSFLKSAPGTESEDIKILKSLANIVAKHYLKK
ncbi:hypothetical protein M970_010740 [Encephalitozoon cuniculi EcunIII-L]|nr:hypothetical protein M970_010740 [Encephalitozoon cuniculi EcunIII-L]